MRKLIFVLLFLFAACCSAQTATKLVSTWTAAAYPAGTPNCSATVTKSCALGYTLTIQPPNGPLVKIPYCDPVTPVQPCIGPNDTSYTWQPGSILPYGAYTATLATVSIWDDGTTNPSVALTANALYGPAFHTTPVPGGLSVQFTK